MANSKANSGRELERAHVGGGLEVWMWWIHISGSGIGSGSGSGSGSGRRGERGCEVVDEMGLMNCDRQQNISG